MALPFIGNKKKKVGRPKGSKNKTKKSDDKSDNKSSRLGKLAKATVDYTVIRPSKFLASQTIAGLAKEMPETTILTNLLGDFAADISNIFSKQKKNNDKEDKKTDSEKIGEVVKTALEAMATAFDNQTRILSQNLKDIDITLGTLDNIYGELRTLSSITAKVWDVSNKQLYDTRYRNKKLAVKEKEKRFEDSVKSVDNQTLQENLDSIAPINDNDAKGEKGLLSKMGGGLMDKLKEWLGMGAGISAGGGLLSIVNGIAKSILKGVASLIFSKVGLATLIGGSILAIGKYIWDNRDQIMDYMVGLWDDAKDWTFQKIGEGWDYLKTKGEEFIDWMKNGILSIPESISNMFSSVINGMKDGILSMSKFLPKWVQKKLGIEHQITSDTSKDRFVQVSNDNPLASIPEGNDTWMNKQSQNKGVLNSYPAGGVGDVTDMFQKIKEQEKQEKRISDRQSELTFNDIVHSSKSGQPVIINNTSNAPQTNTNTKNTAINISNGMGYRERQIRDYYNIDKY